jgi:hypothetical protein
LEELFLSKIDPEIRNEMIEREIASYQNKLDNNKEYLSYEIESLVSTMLQNEILLCESISSLCDKFFEIKNFNVYSIIEKLDTTFHNYLDEVE